MCPSENSGGASRTRRLDQCSRREARRRLARCHANLDVLAVRDESGTLADSAVAGAPRVWSQSSSPCASMGAGGSKRAGSAAYVCGMDRGPCLSAASGETCLA